MNKMKSVIFIFSVLCAVLLSCSRDDLVNNPVVTTKGALVLYEGTFTERGDYAFIDLSNGMVSNNVFRNSNGGANLNIFPDGIRIHNGELFITAQGTYGGPGTIYKLNSTTNQLISTANFGKNPYNFIINNGRIYVTNISGSFISVLDLNFGIVDDSIEVGPNPTNLIYTHSRYFVTKASYTTENSLAVYNEANGMVYKTFFPAPPVSIVSNIKGYFVSGYTSKKLYRIDSTTLQIIDSLAIPTQYSATGDLLFGGQNTIFAVGVNIETFVDVGKEIYKINLLTVPPTVTLLIPFQPGLTNNIYGAAYEEINKEIYLADNNGGNQNGSVRVYDASNGIMKRSYSIGGKNPVRFTFKY